MLRSNVYWQQQTLTEAMRLLTPTWRTGRVVLEEIELTGYPIPAGVFLCISSLVTQCDRNWSEATPVDDG